MAKFVFHRQIWITLLPIFYNIYFHKSLQSSRNDIFILKKDLKSTHISTTLFSIIVEKRDMYNLIQFTSMIKD